MKGLLIIGGLLLVVIGLGVAFLETIAGDGSALRPARNTAILGTALLLAGALI